MKKTFFIIAIILLLSSSLVNAITEQEMNEAKGLISSKADCESLSNSQLEIIGEYYMEQMHPGEAHKLMHEMMGLKEGTEAEEQFHINLAKTMYCGENNEMMSSGGMMMNMMGAGMMGWQTQQTNTMQGIMGNWGNYGYWNFLSVLYAILLIGLIILVYLWIIKSWKNTKSKGGKK